MKFKLSFVTNSSSTAYLIYNKTDEPKDLVDFVLENPHLIEEYREEYDWHKDDPEYTQIMLVKSAKMNNEEFPPKYQKYCTFGDEDATLIGEVFDYILRGGGESKSFKWKFFESRR